MPPLTTAVLRLPKPPSLLAPVHRLQFHASAPLRGLRIRLKNAGPARTYEKRVPRSQAIPASVEEAALRVGKRIPKDLPTGRDMMIRDATRREEQRAPSVLKAVVTESVLEQQLSNTPIIAGSYSAVKDDADGCRGADNQEGEDAKPSQALDAPPVLLDALSHLATGRQAGQFLQVCPSRSSNRPDGRRSTLRALNKIHGGLWTPARWRSMWAAREPAARVRAIAAELHHDVYRAFAAADPRTLRRLCKSSFYRALESRIAAAPEGRRARLDVSRPRGAAAPRVVHRVMTSLMPPREKGADDELEGAERAVRDTVLDQAVVRIESEQVLTVAAESVRKAATEYLVLQRVYCSKRFGPWRVWGIKEPATFESWMADVKEKQAIKKERRRKADELFNKEAKEQRLLERRISTLRSAAAHNAAVAANY